MHFKELIAVGFAGSGALTGIHQALKNKKNTPRVDLLGQQAIEKMLGEKKNRFSDKALYGGTLAGDLISNALCYSIIARAKRSIITGLLVGAFYGVGTLLLPQVLGLNERYVASSPKTKYMTIGYYAFGGFIAGVLARLIRK